MPPMLTIEEMRALVRLEDAKREFDAAYEDALRIAGDSYIARIVGVSRQTVWRERGDKAYARVRAKRKPA